MPSLETAAPRLAPVTLEGRVVRLEPLAPGHLPPLRPQHLQRDRPLEQRILRRHHDALAAVRYPGLPSHPQHAVAARQMTGGFGGMLSLQVAGGAEAALRVAGRVKLFARATSLGGVESLIEHRASVEPPDSPVPKDLLRVSIGLEDPDELVEDLRAALS